MENMIYKNLTLTIDPIGDIHCFELSVSFLEENPKTINKNSLCLDILLNSESTNQWDNPVFLNNTLYPYLMGDKSTEVIKNITDTFNHTEHMWLLSVRDTLKELFTVAYHEGFLFENAPHPETFLTHEKTLMDLLKDGELNATNQKELYKYLSTELDV